MQKKSIVISGVSIDSGGPLTIYKDLLLFLSESELSKQYNIIAIVHNKELFKEYIPNIQYISIPKADNWLLRLYYEYFGFRKISKRLNSYLWLSLQVATPNVITRKQAIYIHNPSPFYNWNISDFNYGSRYILFAIFFKYIYKINIKRNNYLIVQQSWIRDKFSKMYNISPTRIIVSYPNNKSFNLASNKSIKFESGNSRIYSFFYPALPRVFKNYEIVCEAVKILRKKGVDNFEVILTIDGSENKYSRNIIDKYSDLEELKFIGLIPHKDVYTYYRKSDCLIFPSKLETWGLPISEFSQYKKPMIIADLPYAHETAGGCDLVTFFDVNNAIELASKMEKIKDGDLTSLESIPIIDTEEFVVSSWKETFKILLE